MKTTFSFILSLFFMLVLVYGQAPDDFYKSGFPEGSGSYEKDYRGTSDIQFYYSTNYYKTPYDIRAIFPLEKVPKSTITKVTVNGEKIENYAVFNNHVYSKFNIAKGKDDLVVACLANWEYEKFYTVTIFGTTENEKDFELSVTSKSPTKNITFNLPDNRFKDRYISIPSAVENVQPTQLKEVFINSLPVKNFEIKDNNVNIPVNWRSKTRYDIILKTEKKEISLKALAPKYEMSFGYPTGTFQFYHLTYTFEKENVLPFILNKVSVNGQEIRDFTISGIDDKTIAIRGYQRRYPQYNKKVTGNTDVSLTVRCNWQKGLQYTLSVKGIDESGQQVILSAKGIPENKFDYWNPEWKYYATVVLKENAGIRRVQEPVHLKMAFYTDRLTDPENEIRVVEYDPYQKANPKGPFKEIPSQVYHIHTWKDNELIDTIEKDEESGTQIVRYLATTTFEVAFFANVYPYSEKIYLVFYGNPDAEKPDYPTDLKISGPEIGQIIENKKMRIDLDNNSGAIFAIFLKQGKDILLEHKLETNGAIHWNPGAYSPPHAWVHTSDWKKVQFEQVSGPVFHMTKRYAPLPHMENVMVTITYIFYAGKPYMISSSLTEVTDDFYGKALRNGEIVFNHEELNEFAYKTLMGEIKEIKIESALRHPEHVVDIPYNVPWVAFVNSQKKIGFGSIALELTNTNKYGGMSDAEQPYYYVANGPWIYFSRALNYSFGSNNPSRMIRSAKGSMYFEKTAFIPFLLGGSQPDKYTMIENTDTLLRHPLHVSYYLDTDNRNNTGWVIPILVEPFDEGVKGAVGKEKK